MKVKFGFSKEERLNHASDIENLFRDGRYVVCHPLKIIYLVTEKNDACITKVLITVSSRKFRHAVDRNRIKRKMKEVYRLNKHIVKTDSIPGSSLILAIIYTGEERLPAYSVIESAFVKCSERLNHYLKHM